MKKKQHQPKNKKQRELDHTITQEIINLLHDLKQLYEDGVVTVDEFESGRSKLLESLR